MDEPFARQDIRIVVIGGGTGSFTLLSELKKHTSQIAAIVNMADDGGSTGVLRDELGVLPPGDVRQCLVALSNSDKLRDLFSYRFAEGTFEGHAFGNILLTALEKMTGSFDEAVKTASDILRINGKVVPATLDDIRLRMEWPDENMIIQNEHQVTLANFKHDPRKAILSLTPSATANPLAISAIEKADIIVIAPGDIYSSIGPLLVIDGIREALKKTCAIKVYVANLVTKNGQTTGFTVSDHAGEVERFVGTPFLDYVLYNEQIPDKQVAKQYKEEKAFLVKVDTSILGKAPYIAVPGHFLGKIAVSNKSDKLVPSRSLIRHDAAEVVKVLLDLYGKVTG